jgi:sugar/nucleoside kinase (ribokinase family)
VTPAETPQCDSVTPSSSPQLDVACFSYLACAHLCFIDTYPEANSGAEILDTIDYLAGDGPIVAVISSGLGLRSGLVSNRTARDSAGRAIDRHMFDNGVVRREIGSRPMRTPFAFILNDRQRNREWFSYLVDVKAKLLDIPPSAFNKARVAYIDCYADFVDPAMSAMSAARRSDSKLYVNLGGAAVLSETLDFISDIGVETVQVSVAEIEGAEALARHLAERAKAEVIIVTAGSHGALALHAGVLELFPAYPIHISHSHGAGAAFSAGYIWCLIQGCALHERLEFASALAALYCSSTPGTRSISATEVAVFVDAARREY